MSDAPTSAISPLMIIIVIFIVVIIFFTLGSETREQILGIFDQAFFGEEKDKENAQLATVATHASLISGIDECKDGETINPNAKSECFCHTGTFGVISDKSYFSVENVANSLLLTARTENQEPLTSVTEPYTLGLMVVKNNGYNQETDEFDWEVGCVFPSTFYIKGIDEDTEKTLGSNIFGSWDGENLVNNWYFLWKDPLVAKSWYQSGDFSEFQLYREKINSDYPEMAYAPVLYKVSDTQYCIVTDLIEEPLTISSSYTYKTIPNSEVGEAQISTGSIDRIFQDAKPFFIDNSRYCNKL